MDVLKFSEYYIVERKIVNSRFTLSGDSFVHDSWGANGVKRKSFSEEFGELRSVLVPINHQCGNVPVTQPLTCISAPQRGQ